MPKNESDLLAEIDRVVRDVVAPAAAKVDAEGVFPKTSIDALAAAGALGVLSAESVGGAGLGPRQAAAVVERIATVCGSTAMVTTMHLSAAAVLEKHGADDVRREVATGKRLVTLAFSEAGSRSHFWAPVSTAKAEGGQIRLDAQKSWATSASHADYVWSSKPVAAEGASTLWLVPRATKGLSVPAPFEGLGLRGNDSSPIKADGVMVPESARLGDDGKGFDVMMGVVLPMFQVMSAACSLGFMEAAVAKTAAHAGQTKLEHLDSPLRDLPTIRAYIARMRIATDMVRGLLLDTLDAMEKGRPDTMLRVLEIKAAAGESATQVLDTAMRVTGGAAFRKEVGVERIFRDARAATVMAPTTDVLYDFIGKAACGMNLF
jgi:alkylation response protein AidB-like acyl-CoA dehydrogenase